MNKEQQFYEWCGVKPEEKLVYDIDGTTYIDHNWFPPIDLNFLFKWAVPKLHYMSLQHSTQYVGGIDEYYAQASVSFGNIKAWSGDDPAQAIYKAIQEVRNAK